MRHQHGTDPTSRFCIPVRILSSSTLDTAFSMASAASGRFRSAQVIGWATTGAVRISNSTH